MYHTLAKLYPKKMKDEFYRLFSFLNIHIRRERFLGFIFFNAFFVALILAFYVNIFFYRLPLIPFILGLFFFNHLMIYFLLLSMGDKKAKFVDEILPDALQLMASNLRAGYTTDKALILSARPEFGPFKDEIMLAGKEIATGKNVSTALMGVTKRVPSKKLERTIKLMLFGMQAGGEMAGLVEQIADDLRQQSLIEDRISNSVNMYVIFIFFTLGFGAPFLFSISSFLVKVLASSMAMVDVPTSSLLPIASMEVNISQPFIVMYCFLTMCVAGVMGSLIIGLISHGKEKEGIKYIPMILLVASGIFFAMRWLLELMFSSII